MDKIKEELGLPKDQKNLLIYDVFKGQTIKRYTDFLLENGLAPVHVPANLTRKFQPLDINLSGVAKVFSKINFKHGTQTKYKSRWIMEKAFVRLM